MKKTCMPWRRSREACHECGRPAQRHLGAIAGGWNLGPDGKVRLASGASRLEMSACLDHEEFLMTQLCDRYDNAAACQARYTWRDMRSILLWRVFRMDNGHVLGDDQA